MKKFRIGTNLLPANGIKAITSNIDSAVKGWLFWKTTQLIYTVTISWENNIFPEVTLTYADKDVFLEDLKLLHTIVESLGELYTPVEEENEVIEKKSSTIESNV